MRPLFVGFSITMQLVFPTLCEKSCQQLSGKSTWQWKMDLLKMHSLFNNVEHSIARSVFSAGSILCSVTSERCQRQFLFVQMAFGQIPKTITSSPEESERMMVRNRVLFFLVGWDGNFVTRNQLGPCNGGVNEPEKNNGVDWSSKWFHDFSDQVS